MSLEERIRNLMKGKRVTIDCVEHEPVYTNPAMAQALEPLVGDRELRISMANKARAVAIPDSAERVTRMCREYLPA